MIFIVRRKAVILMIFTFIFALSTFLLHHQSTNVFSGELTGRIVVDGGHGLPDGGAIGANGTIESTLNIKIAKLVQKSLSKKGYSVIMTRTGEDAITGESETISARKKSDMHKRLKIINSSKADMFVSIHMNKFPDSRYRGAQVLYSGNFGESALLAGMLQKELHSLPDNKSKRTHLKAPDGIFLLKNAQIPAVIVECGFLSNYDEEKLLNTAEYQKQLAKAIVRGIESYYERNGKNENIRN